VRLWPTDKVHQHADGREHVDESFRFTEQEQVLDELCEYQLLKCSREV
jgi:hypothetical protein